MGRARDAPRPGRQIVGLDVLRFAAALLVLGFHLACTQWLVASSEASDFVGSPIPLPGLLPVAAVGWIGVQAFFVISGFVIVLSAAGSGAHRFLVNRALRLLPCAWICATISLALALVFAREGASELLARYLRTLVLFPAPRWIDGAYWTLGVEISFYALVYGLLRAGRSDWLEPVVMTLGALSAGMWCLAATPLWPGLDVLANKRLAQLTLVTHGCYFALGVLIRTAAEKGWTPRRLCVGALCIAGAMAQIDYVAHAVLDDLGPGGTPVAAVSPHLMFLGFLALFGLAVRFNDALSRRLGRGVVAVRAIGLATYPLYLLHTFVGGVAMRAAYGAGLSPVLCLTAGIAVAAASALAVSGVLEPPLRAGLRRLIERPEAGAPVAARS